MYCNRSAQCLCDPITGTYVAEVTCAVRDDGAPRGGTRWFYRVSVAGSVEEAIDMVKGGVLVLHTTNGGEVVGVAELPEDPTS